MQIFADSPITDSLRDAAHALGTRYRDGYRVAGTLVFLGTVLKVIAFVGAIGGVLLGLGLMGSR